MSISHRSSHASGNFRCEWRPSRLLGVALVVIGLLAGCAVLVSEMPRAAAWPLALVAMLAGIWLARRDRRRAPIMVVWSGISGVPMIDGRSVADAQLHWRGPLAMLRYTEAEGRKRTLVWWPDTLPTTQRRELRLAAGAPRSTPAVASMAP